MNLRLDAKSIRLRFTHAEAACLASERTLEERLPFFDGDLLLRVCSGDRLVFASDANRRHVDIVLSKTKLTAILSAVSNNGRAGRAECEAKEFLNIGERSIEVRIEVDRMTLSSQKEK